jgi:hypothetical protein
MLLHTEEARLRSFFKWFQGYGRAGEPWLMLGKGPSFALRTQFDLTRYGTLSLNHAVREQPVDVAHVIDIDVIEACGDVLGQNARVVVMPWYPHVGNRVGDRALDEHAREVPELRRLESQGRLLWYDLSTSPLRHGTGPVVEATYFSAEAALNLLAMAGVRQVRSLGVDGGAAYSGAFEDLRGSTLLANGRASFDLQFEGFARTILRTGVDFAPLDRRTPARVYVAHDPNEVLQLQVLEHSIRRRASLTVQTIPVSPGGPHPIEKGDAVVLSARAQVLADLRPLWKTQLGDLDLVIPAETQLSGGPGILLAGAGLTDHIPALAAQLVNRVSAETIAHTGSAAVRTGLPPQWNPGWTGHPVGDPPIVLYARDGAEPWLSRSHSLGHLWMRDLLDGIALGFISAGLVAEEVRRGHARPSLLFQVEQGLEEPLLLPRRARRQDRGFQSRAPQWSSIVQALARQLSRRTRALRQRSSQAQPPSNSGLVIPP